MEAFLKSQPKIDVVYAQNDDMGLGAIEAIQAAGKVPGKDIKIITVDAVKDGMQALADGKINFIVECSPLLGPQLMDLAKKVKARPDCAEPGAHRGDHVRPGRGAGRAAGAQVLTRRRSRTGTGRRRPRPLPAVMARVGRERPMTDVPGRGDARHHGRLPGRQGPRRGRLPAAARRGARAHGRERRGQVHPDQGADRRLRHRRGHHPGARATSRCSPRPGAAQAGRDRDGVPGGEPLPQPHRRGEHPARPRAAQARAHRPAGRPPPGRRAARPAQPGRRPGLGARRPPAGRPAAGGHRQGGRPRRRRADPRRAHLQPRRRRGRASCSG